MSHGTNPAATQLLKGLERGLRGREIDVYHRRQLSEIVRYAKQNTPYYRTRLEAFTGDETVDTARWGQVPILTRDVVRRHHAELVVPLRALPPDAGAVRRATTSGTTGEPIEFQINRLADIFSQVRYRAYFTDWGIKTTEHVLTARNPKNSELALAGRLVTNKQPGGGEESTIFSLAIDKVLDAAVKVRPRYLRTFPGVAWQCAVAARRQDLDISFERIMTVGETLDASTQTLIEDVFDCKVADAYATTEFGLVASGCPKCGNYHLSHEGLFVELVDELGRTVRPGGTGRVLVTGLYGYAMPLIRYELADYATRAKSSGPCGDRGLTFGRIMGRRRGMFRLPNGGLVWPHIPPAAMHELGVTGYQVVQTGVSDVRVVYTSANQVAPVSLATLVHQFISPDYRVTVESVSDIPVAPSGKRAVFESLVMELSP